MFNLYGNERLTEWKRFRDSLETSPTPLEDVVDFWSRAPFVNPYLDPQCPETWPTPWQLVLDLKLDDLAICLAMLYTLQLTQRFMGETLEIHMSMLDTKKDNDYYLIVGDTFLLDHQTRSVDTYKHDLHKLWSPTFKQ